MTGEPSFLEAIKWAYTANWSEKAFSGIFTFILAAMLGPREFGIIAIALIYVSFIQMFLEQGLATALIQKKDLAPDHLNAVFWVDVLASIALIFVSISFCGIWAKANQLPELKNIISVLSLCLLIQGLAVVQASLLKRAMNFKSIAICTNISVVTSGAVGVGMAYADYGVWALVGQQLCKDFVFLCLLWVSSKWRPRLRFSWAHLKDLLKLSSMNFAAQLGIFADVQASNIILGLLFGPVAVGVYRLADRLVNMVLMLTQAGFQAVSLPEFSRHRDNPNQLRGSIITCIKMSATLTLPALAGLAIISDSVVELIGPIWIPASAAIKVLCVWGMVIIFAYFTGPLLQALQRSHNTAILEWARTISGIIILLIISKIVEESGIDMQVMGVAVSRLIHAAFLVTPIFLLILMRLSNISLYDIMSSVIPSIAASGAVVGAVVMLLKSNLLVGQILLVSLAIQIAIGTIFGSFVLFLLDAHIRKKTIEIFGKLIFSKSA